MKRFGLKERLHYWFDTRMTHGTGSMIRLLAYMTLLVILGLSGIVFFSGAQDGDFFSALWDTAASTINAWMPFATDGSPLWLFLMLIAAIVGLLLTSILISILTTGIEDRLSLLRRGTSIVLEHDHTVILGFNPGAYQLIREMCLANPGKKKCIVVAGSVEKETMEELLHDNIDIPREVKIICRNIDICDSVALRCCAIPYCKTVIINEPSDIVTVKSLLAVSTLLRDHPENHVAVATHVENADYYVPAQEAGEGRATILPIENIVARMIARTCTQAGITGAFTELFNFSGCELYFEIFPELIGKSFFEITTLLELGTPIGICRNGRTTLNPPKDTVLQAGDELLVLEDDKGCCRILPAPLIPSLIHASHSPLYGGGNVLILGRSRSLLHVVTELRENATSILVAGVPEDESFSAGSVSFSTANIEDPFQLEALVCQADHVVIMSNEKLTSEEADAQAIVLLLRIRELRSRLNLSFNITVEMKLEQNKRLVPPDEYADFVISSDISSMMIAQVAETPALVPVFKEILSHKGNELYLIPAKSFVELGTPVCHADMRGITQSRQAVYLGYTHTEPGNLSVILNPPPQEDITFQDGDGIVVLCESLDAIS